VESDLHPAGYWFLVDSGMSSADALLRWGRGNRGKGKGGGGKGKGGGGKGRGKQGFGGGKSSGVGPVGRKG